MSVRGFTFEIIPSLFTGRTKPVRGLDDFRSRNLTGKKAASRGGVSVAVGQAHEIFNASVPVERLLVKSGCGLRSCAARRTMIACP